MPESYQIIFNSQGSNAVQLANANSVMYTVNWDAFLPKRYKKFLCQFIFKSTNTNAAALTSNGFINLNFGRVNSFDGQTMTTNLGIIYPQITGAYYYYSSTNNDNCAVTCDYPQSNQVMLNLITFAGASLGLPAAMNYALILNLIGVDEEDRLATNYDSNNLITRA